MGDSNQMTVGTGSDELSIRVANFEAVMNRQFRRVHRRQTFIVLLVHVAALATLTGLAFVM